MTALRHPKKKITAGELLKQLEKDPKFSTRAERIDKQRESIIEENSLELAPLLAELATAGYNVDSLDALSRRFPTEEVVPILLRWLPRLTRPDVKETVVRALSVPWAKPSAVIPLIDEFRKTSGSVNPGLKWAIGNSLEVLASDVVFDDIVELVQDNRQGKSREMLVMALGRMKNPKAVDVLIAQLDDNEVVGHALIALRKLKAKQARPRIELLVNHPNAWVRKEARHALSKI